MFIEAGVAFMIMAFLSGIVMILVESMMITILAGAGVIIFAFLALICAYEAYLELNDKES